MTSARPKTSERTQRRFRIKAVSVLAGAGLILTGVAVTTTVPAAATHFRAAQLSWEKAAAANTAHFDLTMSYRRNYNGWVQYQPTGGGTSALPNVGDILQDGNNVLDFGDGSKTNPFLRVSTVDAAANTITVEAIATFSGTAAHGINKTYASSAARTARITSCCRLSQTSGHMNNPDKGLGVGTLVDLANATASPESSLPPVVDCPTTGACNFFVPSSVPSGTDASFRLANQYEATDGNGVNTAANGLFVQPTNASINATTGLYQLNVTNLARAAAPLDTYYSTQVIINAVKSGTSTVVSSVAVDVFLRITNQTNKAPNWSATTPADGTTYSVTPGQTVTVDIGATDPDTGDVVTLGAVNAPSGTFTQLTTGKQSTGRFTFTPSVEGQTIVNFTATDQKGLSATQRSIKVVATKKSPTIVWPAPTQIVWGTALGAAQLNATLSTAAGANVPPLAGTFTYTPAAGTVLEPGAQALQVTWTPDPADAQGWNAVTATNSITVVKADQSLSFTPAIDPSVSYTYGDPAFTVTASATSGLAPQYAVGSADDCTQTAANPGASVTITAAGSCTLSVTQPGDVHYNAAAPISHTFTIAQRTPTIDWAPGAMTYGQLLSSAQLNAVVSPAEAGANGSLTYTVDGNLADTTSTLAAGDHTLTVTYVPNAGAPGSNYTPASRTISPFTVAQAAQTITFDAVAGKTFGSAPFTVSPSTTSGLLVSVDSSTPDVCTVSASNQVSLLHAGDCTLVASQSGDSNYLAADSVTRTFAVAKADQSIAFTAPGPLTYGGAPVALTATGGGSNLPVTFHATPTNICSLDSSGTTLLILGAGLCTVTVDQDGNGDFNAADTVSSGVTIDKATPVLSWTTPAPIDYGTALSGAQLSATISPVVTGDIAYYLADGSTPAAGAILNASATPQVLKAVFTPTGLDADNYNGTDGSTTILVNKADQSITVNPVSNHTYGDPDFAVTAQGGPSGNAVTFSSPSTACAVTSSGIVSISAAGACLVLADQAGNSNYNAAAQESVSITIDKRTPTLDWANPANITYGTALDSTQLNASVTPSEAGANGSLAYTTDASSAAAAGQVLHAGQHTLTVKYTPNATSGGDNFTAAMQTVQLTVDKASQTLTFGALANATYGDPAITLSATRGASGVPVTFSVDPGSSCTVSGTTLTLTGAGTCTVIANEAGNLDYLPATPVSQTFTIAKAAQTITFGALANKIVGDPAFTVSATGGASGNAVVFTAGPASVCSVTGSTVSIAGPGSCTVTASQSGNANYIDATTVARTFAVSYRDCLLFDPTKPAKAGSAIPVKVMLCDRNGRSVSAATIVLHAEKTDSTTAQAAGGSAGTDNNFRFVGTGGGSYQYNLKTDGLSSGNHRFSWTVLGDPAEHSVTIVIS